MGLSTMPSALPSIRASAFLVPGILALLIRDPRRSRFVGFGGGAGASFLGLVVTPIGTMRGTPMHIPTWHQVSGYGRPRHHHHPCMASMEVGPELSDTLMHLSGYVFRAAINAALRGM
jgi:hypothetical protein